MPAQSHSNFLVASQGTIPRLLVLGVVIQPVTVTASKDSSPVQDGNPTPTPNNWTAKPGARAAIIAGRPINAHGILFRFPVTAVRRVPIRQPCRVQFGGHSDAACFLIVSRPADRRVSAWQEQTLSMEPAYIQGVIVGGRVLSTSATVSASHSTQVNFLFLSKYQEHDSASLASSCQRPVTEEPLEGESHKSGLARLNSH